MRIGVDVGGTNTDAVLMDGRAVKATHKAPTSANISDGIVTVIRKVLQASAVATEDVQAVMVGTTHFTNAFVERQHLLEVGVLRLALPATKGLAPMVDWPAALANSIGKHHYLVKGGYEFDGRPIEALDEKAIASAAKDMRERGLKAVAISGVFSPVNSDMEERAEEILRNEIADISITLSSRIGRIGLLERENAAIMNASLAGLSRKVVASFQQALTKLNITAPFYISQNDGTLMNAGFVEKYPVLTFACGPTNSMRGAAYLSGLKDALVADIGGTTTDVGMLVNGFPRESTVTVDIGGVRTNFRMPDILAIGLGGGSLVRRNGDIKIGPQSVGYRLLEEAQVFGGEQLTATDMAVAAGFADVGEPEAVATLPKAFVERTTDIIHRMLEEAVDRMKTHAAPLPLVLVGGGSILIKRSITGTSDCIVPEHADVANAIGASIAQIGGEVDKVYSYEQISREEATASAKAEAVQRAVDAGADANSVAIIDFEETPLAYMPGNAVRVRAKAAGELTLC